MPGDRFAWCGALRVEAVVHLVACLVVVLPRRLTRHESGATHRDVSVFASIDLEAGTGDAPLEVLGVFRPPQEGRIGHADRRDHGTQPHHDAPTLLVPPPPL